MHVYTMQSTLIPKGLCDSLEQIQHRFIWNDMDQGRG